MESKKKAIDPAPIIEKLAARCLETKGLECSVLGNVIDMLRAAPSANAVEVVRCKECRYCDEQHPVGKPTPWYNCTRFTRVVTTPDHFCSYGERKDK